MIRFAQTDDCDKIIKLWNSIFGDSKESIEIFFRLYYQNILVYEKNKALVSMLTMLPVTINDKKGRYIYAVATDESFRGMGLSTELLKYANDYILTNGEFFSVLVPANAGLFDFYKKRGYKTVSCIEKCEFIPENTSQTAISKISAYEYKQLRKEILSEKTLIEWSKKELENISDMYSGAFYHIDKYNAIFFCFKEGNKLIIKELCCDTSNINTIKSAISGYFNCDKIEMAYIGNKPYAMIYPDSFENIYFNIALD